MTSDVDNGPLSIPPDDKYNRQLVDNVHPATWENPLASGRYNLVVIGAGTAGLVAAAGAAGLGAKVALIEKHLMGGDCLNVGCVPSKSVISSSRIAALLTAAESYGMRKPDQGHVDFAAVMKRMRKIRAGISEHDSAWRFRELGVHVFIGKAHFSDAASVEVGGQRLIFKRALIASGARAATPPIPGIDEAGFLTNETIFNLTNLPPRLAVIGAGPIGCELAQAFQRLGSRVSILEKGEQILAREDADAAAIVQRRFVDDGIDLVLGCTIGRVEKKGREKIIHYNCGGEDKWLAVDEILIGVGRQPNVEELNLETAGVEYDPRHGIQVNDRLQTSSPRVYAAGDVCMQYKFTHAADAAARIVLQNALFFGRKKLSALTVPWCTYTDPEIAHVGLHPPQAERRGIEIDTFTVPMKNVDRAIADGEDDGFVKLHTKKGKDTLLGATIVAAHAGEMISEITTAIVGKLGLSKLAQVIHPYPTQTEAIKKAADAYSRTRLTPRVKRMFERWLAWNR